MTPHEVPLPPGCTLEATIPGEDDAFGILYQSPQGPLGAVIWDGFASQVCKCGDAGSSGLEIDEKNMSTSEHNNNLIFLPLTPCPHFLPHTLPPAGHWGL